MALRRCRDVNYVRTSLRQHLLDVAKAGLDRESVRQLARHQQLTIAAGDHFGAVDALNLMGVSFGNLAASDDGDLKHAGIRLCSDFKIAFHSFARGDFRRPPQEFFQLC